MSTIKIVKTTNENVTIRGASEVTISWDDLRAASRQSDDSLAVPYTLALLDATADYYGWPVDGVRTATPSSHVADEAKAWIDWRLACVTPCFAADLVAVGGGEAKIKAERERYARERAAAMAIAEPVARRMRAAAP